MTVIIINIAKSRIVRLIKQLQSPNCSSLYSFAKNNNNTVLYLNY